MKQATKFIHAGAKPDPSTGAIMTPIYQTSTYVQEAPGKNKGFEYARSQNPTRQALEEALAVIENGKFGLAFGSGVAATDAVIKLLEPGDEVIAASDMYGGTYHGYRQHKKNSFQKNKIDLAGNPNQPINEYLRHCSGFCTGKRSGGMVVCRQYVCFALFTKSIRSWS